MKSAKASLKDIAEALNVSVSTVSRALKNHPDINDDTCKRVQEYARKVHYRPNILALGLKHQRSMTIGVVVPEIVHHFFSSIISGIEDLAYGEGYRVMICQSNEDYLREVMNVQALMDHRVDGMLVSISKSTLDHQHFVDLANQGVPLVFMDRACNDLVSDKVLTNDYEGARMVVRHLLKRGCRNILHLAGPQHLCVGRERQEGYIQALNDYGLTYREDFVIRCDTPSKVESRKNKILGKAENIDGIFCVNDFTAAAVMRLLQDNGYDVPGQVAVVGFGDDPLASMVRPRLTTVEQRGYDMGKTAARMLLNRLSGDAIDDDTPKTKVFPAFLKVRESG